MIDLTGISNENEFYTHHYVGVILKDNPKTSSGIGPAGTKSAPSRHQVEILRICMIDSTLLNLMASTGRVDRTKFRKSILNPLLKAGLVELTIPDKPNSSRQKYRLTSRGRALLIDIDGKPGE